MTGNITAISFDRRTFRFSPYTQHESFGPGGCIMTYDDVYTPERGNNVVKVSGAFRGVAKQTDENSVLYIQLSGLKADPNIDFTLQGQKISVKAAEYLTGYGEYLKTIPEEERFKLEENPHALDRYDQEWSIKYFREKLSNFLDGSDELFCAVFRGIDNAMGDLQRSVIFDYFNDLHKERHGSFDLPVEDYSALKRDI